MKNQKKKRSSGPCSGARAAGASPTSSPEIGRVATPGKSDRSLIEVAAAVIERPDGSFLLAQRPPGKLYAGWWEFPGGKVNPGESAAEALEREILEELGITVVRAYPWIT